MPILSGVSGVNRALGSVCAGVGGVNRALSQIDAGASGVNRTVFSSGMALSELPRGAKLIDPTYSSAVEPNLGKFIILSQNADGTTLIFNEYSSEQTKRAILVGVTSSSYGSAYVFLTGQITATYTGNYSAGFKAAAVQKTISYNAVNSSGNESNRTVTAYAFALSTAEVTNSSYGLGTLAGRVSANNKPYFLRSSVVATVSASYNAATCVFYGSTKPSDITAISGGYGRASKDDLYYAVRLASYLPKTTRVSSSPDANGYYRLMF